MLHDQKITVRTGFFGGLSARCGETSASTIDLDSNPEAQYLHQLAQGAGMSADACDRIHEQPGAPKLHG